MKLRDKQEAGNGWPGYKLAPSGRRVCLVVRPEFPGRFSGPAFNGGNAGVCVAAVLGLDAGL